MHAFARRIIVWACAVVSLVVVQFNCFAGEDGANSSTTGEKIRVLIVDGFSNHDWELTTRLLRGILEPSGICECSVSTAPAKADSPGWDSWHPKFGEYNVIIQTCNDIQGGPQWPANVQGSFEEFVDHGGGALVFHSGNNAFPDWPAYNEMIGLGWRKKDQGVALTVHDDAKIERISSGQGEDTSHGPRSEVVVHRLGDHPIHQGLPRAWKTPDLEVYSYARGPAQNLEVLSYGYDGKTKMNWPLEWTTKFGQGRVYNSTFGHVWRGDVQPNSMRCAGEQTLILRAVQWLAKRPITDTVPADFPTADRVSIRPEFKL